MAEITTTQTMGNKTITTTINTAARGPVGSDASVTAANVLTAAQSMTTQQESDMRAAIGAGTGTVSGDGTGITDAGAFRDGLGDFQSSLDIINAQPFCAKKIYGWTTSAAPPIRGLLYGDSFSTSIYPGPKMGIAGIIGLGRYNASGAVTSLTGRFDYWINGVATEYAVGATGEMTSGGSATGDIRGDKACIAYIKRSGGGSFVLQYASNGGGAVSGASDVGWTTLATIDTSNATTIGAYNEYSLPTSNAPFFRLRIKTVTTGSVVIIGGGIYNSNGGGVIWMPIAANSGITLSQSVQTPSAVLAPIWTGLAPDFVITCSLDDAYEWDSGGNFRVLYDACNAIVSTTDWIQIGPHNVDMDSVENATVDVPAMEVAQRAWAISANQSFISTTGIFKSFAVADARGLMEDNKHLSSAGRQVRNLHLWSKLPLGDYELGGFMTYGPLGGSVPGATYSAISGNFTSQPIEFYKPISVRSAVGGVRFFARASLYNNGASWEIFNDTNDLKFIFGGATGVVFGTSSDTGIHPSFDDAKCGRTSFRWQVSATTVKHAVYTVATLPSASTRGSGTRAFVSDSNATLAAGLGNVVAAGGANITPVYSDGTNWRIG